VIVEAAVGFIVGVIIGLVLLELVERR